MTIPPLLPAGCARPKLLHLGDAGLGALPAPAPLLLSGGRWRRGGYSGWDPLLWAAASGDPAGLGSPTSISYWHNALAPPNASWLFSAAVNESSVPGQPRQSDAYTSILQLDGGPQPGSSSRRLGITYNKRLAPWPNMIFLMPFTVEW